MFYIDSSCSCLCCCSHTWSGWLDLWWVCGGWQCYWSHACLWWEHPGQEPFLGLRTSNSASSSNFHHWALLAISLTQQPSNYWVLRMVLAPGWDCFPGWGSVSWVPRCWCLWSQDDWVLGGSGTCVLARVLLPHLWWQGGLCCQESPAKGEKKEKFWYLNSVIKSS